MVGGISTGGISTWHLLRKSEVGVVGIGWTKASLELNWCV